MYIDTHCHLNFSHYDQDRAMVIGNAKKANVKKCISPGVDLFSSKQSILLSQKHPGVVFAGAGFHPYEAQHDPDVRELEKMVIWQASSIKHQASPTSIIAIGECGLDYHQYKGEVAAGKKDKQKRLFEDQLLFALKHNLPVIMHCRDAYNDFFDVLDSLPRAVRGVIHCFSGGLQEVRMAQERKLFIGIDGNVTYSKQLETIVPHIPISMILLETDSPYLTPIPHRGSRNEPKYIPLIAKKIAELHTVPIEKVKETTTINACTLFSIS